MLEPLQVFLHVASEFSLRKFPEVGPHLYRRIRIILFLQKDIGKQCMQFRHTLVRSFFGLLGALLGVTHHYGMASRLLEFVAAHGQLEITLILVSAAAGLEVGRALIAAGDVPREWALREAARQSLAVVLGCAPWFVLLAIVESFLSPDPNLPAWIKVLFGSALEALFLLAAWNPFLQEKRT